MAEKGGKRWVNRGKMVKRYKLPIVKKSWDVIYSMVTTGNDTVYI